MLQPAVCADCHKPKQRSCFVRIWQRLSKCGLEPQFPSHTWMHGAKAAAPSRQESPQNKKIQNEKNDNDEADKHAHISSASGLNHGIQLLHRCAEEAAGVCRRICLRKRQAVPLTPRPPLSRHIPRQIAFDCVFEARRKFPRHAADKRQLCRSQCPAMEFRLKRTPLSISAFECNLSHISLLSASSTCAEVSCALLASPFPRFGACDAVQGWGVCLATLPGAAHRSARKQLATVGAIVCHFAATVHVDFCSSKRKLPCNFLFWRVLLRLMHAKHRHPP